MSILEEISYNVLSVDDNQNNLFTLNALLSTLSNINSIEVLSAKEALNVLLKEKIDLILCDIQMPDIDGFELAKMIKSNRRTKDIPIIFVTAVFKSEEFIAQGFEIGAVDYVTKPIDDHQLLNKIKLYLKIFEEKNRAIQSEKRFYNIAQSIGDGIYSIDRDNRVTFINEEALKLLGFKEKELMGKKIHEYIHYKDSQNNPITAKECSVHKTMKRDEIYKNDDDLFIKKDGSSLHVSIIAKPLYAEGEIVGTVTIFKDKTMYKKIQKLEHEKVKNQEQIILSMVDMIEARDSYTAGHTRRVAHYCVLIAQEMGYSTQEVELLKNAAWLHDIGKISTPDNILLKPGRLNENEYKIIQEHLTTGYEMLKNIEQYTSIAEIMREHHEKFDGTGYPLGLKGEEIRPLSRIMMVADAFDAMTTNRVYKAKKDVNVAIEELKSLSGKHFHPDVVSAAAIVLKDIVIDDDISQQPKTLLEEQRFSYYYKDRLTNLFIPEYLNLITKYNLDSKSLHTYEIKLHNFSQYNKKFGWKKGDMFLMAFANFIDNFNKESIAFRVEGDDFMLLSEKPLEGVEESVTTYILSQDGDVTCSLIEKFIEDITTIHPQTLF